MKPLIGLTEAMRNPEMFGGTFAGSSFWTWRTLAKIVDNLPLTEPREIEPYQEATGLKYEHRPHTDNTVRRIIILAGRRAGKDRWFSAVAVWRAALCADWSKYASAGEGSVVLLLGRDKRQAAILKRYCNGLLKAPLLAAEVTRNTDDTVEFRNGASLEVATNNSDLVRGRSAVALLGSECCFWKSDEHSTNSDEEVVSAAEKSMAMCPGGGLTLLGSSVYRRAGFMFSQYERLHGNKHGGTDVCWFTPSRVMNPRLPLAVVEKAIAEDGPRGRAEYENQWRTDDADFISLQLLEDATDFGVSERPPDSRHAYWCYIDIATGEGQDSAVLVIGHVRRVPGQIDELTIDVYQREEAEICSRRHHHQGMGTALKGVPHPPSAR
jgi:hypothetical protein